MGMFDKLVQKGKKMAGDYVKEQLSGRSSQQPSGDGNRNAGYSRQAPPASGQQGGSWQGGSEPAGGRPDQATDADRDAIAKYKYMLRTAPPEDMERAHAEAFGRLSPQQRSMLQEELNSQLPAPERPRSDRPDDLARAATRAEVSRPGMMEKILGRGSGNGPGRGMGLAAGAAGGLGAGLLAGVAGGFVGSAIAGPMLEGFSGIGDGIAGAAEGLGDDVTAAGEGFSEQTGGLFDGFLGGGEGQGDWEL